MRGRPRLAELLEKYDSVLRRLSKPKRDFVLGALEGQNRIAGLLSNTADDCARKSDLPKSIQKIVQDLFDYAFDILGEKTIDLRGPHYRRIYGDLKVPVCPFCALDTFSSPEAPQEALDHYLAGSIYPFAAANLRNLVPMCHDCNSKYKKTKDMIRHAGQNTARRQAFDPYDCSTTVRVFIDDSKPFLVGPEDPGAWVIRLDPDIEVVTTWDEVFSVRERYRRDYLAKRYGPWVEHFVHLARKEMTVYSNEELIKLLLSHERDWEMLGLEDRAFLKAAVFRMLRLHCEAGNQDALNHLRDWIYPPAPEAVAAVPDPLPLAVVPPPFAAPVRAPVAPPAMEAALFSAQPPPNPPLGGPNPRPHDEPEE